MSIKRPEYCNVCGLDIVWCKCDRSPEYCDICGAPVVWCKCDNSHGLPTVPSLLEALGTAKKTVAYQRGVIENLQKQNKTIIPLLEKVDDLKLEIDSKVSAWAIMKNTAYRYKLAMEQNLEDHKRVVVNLNNIREEKCNWFYMADEGYYETKCNQSFYFNNGETLAENITFKWCPYCGKSIKHDDPYDPSYEGLIPEELP
jgi:hypothetical protein